MISAIRRGDTVVRLKFRFGMSRLLVVAIDEATGRSVSTLTVPMMAAWLQRHGYTWETGSQARWIKSTPA